MIDLATLDALYALKDLKRAGWLIRGVSDPESVSDHSWGTALLCLLYAVRAGVESDRAVAMALVHDIAEALTGDVAARVDPRDRTVSLQQKQADERAAIERLFPAGQNRTAAEPATAAGSEASVAPDSIRELWQEYEAAVTPEARFVRDMNLIDMCLQALRYQRCRRYDSLAGYPGSGGFERLDEFFATAEPRLSTQTGRELYRPIYAEYLKQH